MVQETLKASCVYCGKEIFSLYKRQLEYNMKAHKLSCPQKAKDLKTKGELNPVDKQTGTASHDHKEEKQKWKTKMEMN